MIVIQKKGTELSAFALDRATGLLMETRDTLAPNSAEFELHPVEGTLSYDYDPIVKEVTFEIDDRGYLVTDSNARAIADKLQYSGTFMEMPQLNITVKVPAKIDWEIGDFIVWDYDGLTYTLRELPQVSKQATENTYGEAFVYENVRFISALADIKYIDFLDVVLEASPSHFSTLPLFSFYGDVFALIDRINANLGRLYNNWEVVAADVESGDVYDALHTLRDVSITSPIKVWDALGLCYSMWGLGFVYHYDSVNAKHIITVGATGGETGNFAYGQGNGLYMVNKNIAKEDAIVTRLRAYGSARNMPSRYYNNKTVLGDRLLFTNPLVYLPNLMLPHYKWDFSAGDPKDAYINSNNTDVDPADTSYAKYGIREASVYFDGSNNLPEIHPTIEGMTALELRNAIANYTESQLPLYYSPSAIIYGDTVRMDRVKVGDTITDEGIIISSDTYSENVAYAGSAGNEIMTSRTLTKAFPEIFGATLTEEGLYNLTFAGQKVTTTCTDATISFGAVTVWLYKNGGKFVLADRISGTAITNGFEYVIPDIEFSATEAGDNYAVGFELELVLSDLEPPATATVAWAVTATTATYQLAKKVPDRTFTIKLKQVGFDVMRFLSSAGLNPVISMTTGACAGREFVIKGTTYNSATDDWTLSCIRQADTSLNNQWFPNANFHIAAEDTFVLLNIDMPEIYINIAEDRLYLAACNWLRRQKEPKWVFEPKIDEVYMAHNPQLIKEGMMMPIEDTDLGISGTKLINSVTITENDGAVRTFDVVLREDADKDLLKYINEAAKYESSSAVSAITNAATNKTQSVENGTTPSTALGYTAENVVNKVSIINENSTTQQYVNAKALYDKFASFGTEYIKNQIASEQTADYWISGKAKAGTLIVPQTAPTLASGEAAIYSLDSGFSGETPSGAGSVESVALTMPTGFSVSGSPITTSGIFGVTFASGYFLPTTTQFASKLDVSLKGSANGLAELDENGFVKNAQLPSYVDDVLEYNNLEAFPITGETGKIYIAKDTNKTYRWGGSSYVVISETIALGETSSTAYRGDRGKIAYDHSQSTGNPHGTTAADVGAATTIHTHTSSAPANDLVASIPNYSGYSFITEASAIGKYNAYSVITTFGQEAGRGFQLMHTAYSNDYYLRDTYNETSAANFHTLWHSGNSNSTSINWSAAKLTSTTLLIPQTSPSLVSGEMAIYGLESGFSGETPSGAGSVESVTLVSNLTGISVTGSPITTSGTFTLNFVTGYSIPTNVKQGEWDNAYTNRITSLTTTGSGAATLVNNVLNIPTYTLPTATASVLGGVKIGSNITITEGVISVHNPVTLGTANGLSLSTQELSLGLASASANGALSSTDWNTFNGKQAKLIGTGASSLVRVNTSGVIAYDNNTYLTGNQTITLSGIITGSGTTAITTAIADGALSIAKTSGLQTALDGKLSTTGKAADSDKLDGQDSTYFQVALTNPVTGTGTNGYIPKFTGASTIGDSILFSGTDKIIITYQHTSIAESQLRINATSFGGVIGSRAAIGFSPYSTRGTNAATFGFIVTNTSGNEKGDFVWALTDLTDGSNPIERLRLKSNGELVTTNYLTMTENINTNLRIPKVAPTNPTSGQYYFYIVE